LLQEFRALAEPYAKAWSRFGKSSAMTLTPTERAQYEKQMAYVSNVCEGYRRRLHRYPNAVGVGVSLKMTGSEVLNKPCIVVFVRKKIRPKERLGAQAIPEFIERVPTDVVEAGVPGLRHYTSRVRPVQPGYSIGHTRVTSGTLGCLACDRDTKKVLLLSNNHVMANSNNASIDDPIVQPGPHYKGSHPTDTVATLFRFNRIVPIPQTNRVDGAVAKPTQPVRADIPDGIGIPTGVYKVNRVGILVEKVGSTTQHTTGYVVAYNASIFPLNYPSIGEVEFVQSVVTTGMSRSGDSGSLLVDGDIRAAGLLFAGMGDPDGEQDVVTYYNDIGNVQDELRIDVITTRNYESTFWKEIRL